MSKLKENIGNNLSYTRIAIEILADDCTLFDVMEILERYGNAKFDRGYEMGTRDAHKI